MVKPERIRSIDIVRALTMLLMIFVNDLWTLNSIPGWLGHKAANVDGMGLADVVFPAFLFIVGLSIPHAIRARQKKGDNKLRILRHIIGRSLALLIMGLFMVNLEAAGGDALPINRMIWQLLMVLAFFLIWNVYRGKVFGRIHPWFLKGLGWAILLVLALIYRDESGSWMQFRWWGILGLIGWGYLLSAMLYLGIGQRPLLTGLVLLLLLLLNVNEFHTPFGHSFRLVVSASNYSLVLCGVFTTSVMLQMQEKKQMGRFLPFLLLLATVLLAAGFLTRPFWGISKIQATPSWTVICAGISLLAFALLYLLADRARIYRWANVIAPAGTMTLTCYLIPYYIYAFRSLFHLVLPEELRTGMPGILKAIIFSLLVIQLTGILGRFGIKLKI